MKVKEENIYMFMVSEWFQQHFVSNMVKQRTNSEV